MSSMRRVNIRKALRRGFEVREDRDVGLFHRLHVASAERKGFYPISLQNLQAQWDALAPRARCTIFIARHDGSPVAGLWLTRFAGVVTFKFGGWDSKIAAPSHANEALHWAVIQWARSQGAHTYDFGGFDRRSAEHIRASEQLDDAFRQTLSFFKLGFGGRLTVLPRARFKFTHPFADAVLGRAAQRFFASAGSRRLVQRLRG
jgi:lipid II:glycine glycyltransferase (peptidoglycan interpeptide bridge formation enzyme)